MFVCVCMFVDVCVWLYMVEYACVWLRVAMFVCVSLSVYAYCLFMFAIDVA